MYEGLKSDCVSDPLLLADLDNSKLKLKIFYQQNYTWGSQSTNSCPSQSLSSVIVRTHSSISRSPEKVNFTSRYQMKDRIMINEIDEYFKLPWEDFESCKPLQWWLGRCSQFPNLYQLVRDIFSIPGKSFFSCSMELLEANLPQHRFCSCSQANFFGWWWGYHLLASRELHQQNQQSTYFTYLA